MSNKGHDSETPGGRISDLRYQGGKTQKDLAVALRVEQSTISKIERNTVKASSEMMNGIAAYFGVSIDFLMRGNGKAEEASKVNKQSEDSFATIKELKEIATMLEKKLITRAQFDSLRDGLLSN